MTTYTTGSLVRARGREWVVQPGSTPDFLLLRPLGGDSDDVSGVHTALERVEPATYPLPTAADLRDGWGAGLLRTALRLGFRSAAGPFRSLAGLAVEPRAYQLVPLLMALRQDVVRLLVADDVGIGKTVEAGLVASELLAQGTVQRLAVLCSPALAEQWQRELRDKFGIDAELVLASTVRSLERGLMMDESLFDRYPFVVVSTDFIKSDRHRHEFVANCPELVIVDEAHTVVADGSMAGGRHQRHELLEELAGDPSRHLVLVTATPHSGKEEGFRNLLALLDPELRTVDLDSRGGRDRLARHMVQRRRADIRRYLSGDLEQVTRFPQDRESRDVGYSLTPEYAQLFDAVLGYAREQVASTDGGGLHQRIRWWSVLALLRALASSPRAAAATLTMRSQAAQATDAAQAEALGRAAVLDAVDDDSVEGLDVTPGADSEPDGDDDAQPAAGSARARLRAMARQAEALEGPAHDAKLKTLVAQVKSLLADGYDPIVFCRFIDTAEYVAEHLAAALRSSAHVRAVTGTLPPAEREDRIRELTSLDGRHVLVATDCLSEGVNLQDAFAAVVHYDLAWNPTRHEQREGRVDRFGQARPVVRAVTLFGEDNSIDGIVLRTLIQRHRQISAATGVHVPVPARSETLVQALWEGVLRRHKDGNQLALDIDVTDAESALTDEWESAAARERESRTKFAQSGIRPDELAAEVAEVRAALGAGADVEEFVADAMSACGGSVERHDDGLLVRTATLDEGLRGSLPPARDGALRFHRSMPVPRHEYLLARTDPAVSATARYVLETALDPLVAGARPAGRAGVLRTAAVEATTVLLLVRYRYHLELRTRAGVQPQVVEDAELVAFRPSGDGVQWLGPEAVEPLLHAVPSGNVPLLVQEGLFTGNLVHVEAALPDLGVRADERAARLAAAHSRVRPRAAVPRVRAQRPVDVLGVYVFVPPLGGQ